MQPDGPVPAMSSEPLFDNERIIDIQVAGDIFDRITEDSDALGIEEAVAVYDALAEAKAKLTVALSLVDTQLRRTLESPREINGQVYYRRKTGKWRPDHRVVVDKIVRRAATDKNGELRPAIEAAAEAVKLAYMLFVAPKTMPKTAGLDELGLDKRDVASWESTGYEIVVDDVSGGDDGDPS
jgi:hypothetical protein